MIKKKPFEESNQSIRDLLDSIVPESKIDSLISSHKVCLFFLDIESYSLINKYIDFILWIIFFLIMDFVILLQSFPSNFFTSLNKYVSNNNQNSPYFIETRLSLQQASILINITISFFVIYQWYKFFHYKFTKHLNHKTATFLHFTAMYFPTIMTPILGIFFGANVITNEDEIQSRDGILLSIYVMVSTILLLANHLIYTYFVNYSLILKNSFFAYWNSPFGTIDFLYFFAVSLLFTFRSGKFDSYTTISGILGIFYGVWSIYRLRYTVFIFSTGKFCFLKILLDSILFGILTIINIWTNITFLQSSITVFILHLFTGLISYLIIGPGNERLRINLFNNSFKDTTSSKFRSSEEALFTLRNGITFSNPAIADPNFIQFLVQNRFSSDLITDVVRLSIYARFDLSSIFIPRVVMNPFDINPLKYMIFQYKLFENMSKSDKIKPKSETDKAEKKETETDTTNNNTNNINNNNLDKNKQDKTTNETKDDPIISDVYHKLEQDKARAEEILDTFWTENDSKQLNIYQLGKAIKEISNEFSMYGSIFKQCESIQDLWHSFVIDVLAMPSAQKIQPNALDMFTYPEHGLLTYLLNYSFPKTTQQANSQKSTFNSVSDLTNDSVDVSHQNMFNESSNALGEQQNQSNLKLTQENSGPSASEISVNDFSEFEIQLSNFQNKPNFFRIQPSVLKKVQKRRDKSELEKYFRSFQHINIRPILVLCAIITVFTCVSAIVYGVDSNRETREALEKIVDVFELMQMGMIASGQLLSTLDNYAIFPNNEYISSMLGISIDDARVFRSQKIPPFESDINFYDKLEKIPIGMPNTASMPNCPTISCSLFANYILPEDSTYQSKECFYYGNLFCVERMKIVTNNKIVEYQDVYTLKLPDYAILLIYLGIFIIIFIVFYFIFDRRMHNYFLKAVAHISCSGSNKNFTERTDISFSFILQFFIFLLILCCTIIMYYGHSIPIEKLKDKSRNYSNITFALGVISIRIQEVMLSVLLESIKNITFTPYSYRLMESQMKSKYFSSTINNYSFSNLTKLIYDLSLSTVPISDLISLLCQEIIFFVNTLTFEKIFPTSFVSIPTINNWTNEDGLSLGTFINDWATFGIENITNMSPESFKFLYMRYGYMNTFVTFIQETYPQTVSVCFIELMKNTFTDWYITILSIILSFIFLSLYVYIHNRKKIWFYGASLLLRRRITKDQRFIVVMRHILENGKIPEFLDILPFAAVVKDENNIIIDSNWRVQKFTKLTTRQLVGQNFDDIFKKKRMLKINPRDIEITTLTNTKNSQDLIVLRENSGIENIKESLNKIIKRFNFPFDFNIGYNPQTKVQMSKNNLIFLHDAVYIEIKLENGIFKPDESFSLFDEIEESFHINNDEEGWIIRRVSCGAMFYTAVCYYNDMNGKENKDFVFDEGEKENETVNKKKRLFLFLSELSNKTQQTNAIIAATMGKISCYSLTPNSNPNININTIVAGEPIVRAHDICLYGTMGRLYIDFNLFEFVHFSREDISFLFVQKQEKRKKRVTFLLDDNINNNINNNNNQLNNNNNNSNIDNNNNNNNNNINININQGDDNDNDNDHRPAVYFLPEWVLPVMPI